ncbi:MAG TPA: hypothetical protein VNL18_15160 [Gemmatimonadales bacterium]|nr:hypothetical protein [Gemmatimonadales bacterium]
MGLAAQVTALTGPLPTIRYRWDPETEILSGHLEGLDGGRGLTGSIELEGKDGSFIVLDVADGVMRGLEIVVWPETETAAIVPPDVVQQGRLLISTRVSQPGIASVELETRLLARRSEDGSTIHVRVGARRKVQATRLADGLILELDRRGDIAGFWLLGVPRLDVAEAP